MWGSESDCGSKRLRASLREGVCDRQREQRGKCVRKGESQSQECGYKWVRTSKKGKRQAVHGQDSARDSKHVVEGEGDCARLKAQV